MYLCFVFPKTDKIVLYNSLKIMTIRNCTIFLNYAIFYIHKEYFCIK